MAVDWLSAVRVCAALAFLITASWQDVRTRLVSDAIWMVMGALGLALLIAEMVLDGAPMHQFLLLFPASLLYYDPYIDREPIYENGKVCWSAVIAFSLAGCIAAISIYLGGLTRLLVIPTMFLLIYMLYFSNVIHGGADAKALMAICLVIPWYPSLPGLPLVHLPDNVANMVDVTFPFVLLVLMMGSAVVLLLPLYNLLYNAMSRDLSFPICLFGVRMNLDEAEKSKVWPMERFVDGKLVRTMFPKRGRDLKKEYEALRGAGVQKVWVTPKIPFIVPLTIGLVLATIIGNVVFWFGTLLAR